MRKIRTLTDGYLYINGIIYSGFNKVKIEFDDDSVVEVKAVRMPQSQVKALLKNNNTNTRPTCLDDWKCLFWRHGGCYPSQLAEFHTYMDKTTMTMYLVGIAK